METNLEGGQALLGIGNLRQAGGGRIIEATFPAFHCGRPFLLSCGVEKG